MAQATATISLGERLHWNDFIKPWLDRLIFVGIGLLIGFYILAPQQTRAGDSYLPSSFTDIPTGIVQVTNTSGVGALLPVRIADSFAHRANGFKGVGVVALGNSFLLYGQTKETTRPTSYNLPNVRAGLEK